jgi:hypothetical protein
VCGLSKLTSISAAIFVVSFGTTTLAQSHSAGGSIRAGSVTDLPTLKTGEQILLAPTSGQLSFAGQSVSLTSARLMAGYASEVAYLAVLEGEASIGRRKAEAGSMLIFQPYGAPTLVERFDGARLRQSFETAKVSVSPDVAVALDRVIRRQQMGVRLGRFRSTSFNVATSGDAQTEMARRDLVGGQAVRAIRFSNAEDAADIAQRTVTDFIEALMAGNASRIAEFLDPVPFGADGLNARIALAQAMIAERDWRTILAGATASAGTVADQWLVQGAQGAAVVALRPSNGFPFIGTIKVEEGQ